MFTKDVAFAALQAHTTDLLVFFHSSCQVPNADEQSLRQRCKT
jgi:hypothetical protein